MEDGWIAGVGGLLILLIGIFTGILILGIMEPMWNMYGSIR